MRWMALVIGMIVAGCGAEQNTRQGASETVTTALDSNRQAAMKPDDVLRELQAGNQRFVENTMVKRDLREQVKATASGQYPAAVVLSCIDSRIPTEMVLDQGIGDIFNARVAGNIVNKEILGSMEFATAVAGAKLVVVMGHTACGAVKGACDGVQLGNVTSLVDNIQPSVQAVTAEAGSCQSKDAGVVDSVATHNVGRTIEEIRKQSEILANLEREGKIKIVGAMYDIGTGKVSFM